MADLPPSGLDVDHPSFSVQTLALDEATLSEEQALPPSSPVPDTSATVPDSVPFATDNLQPPHPPFLRPSSSATTQTSSSLNVPIDLSQRPTLVDGNAATSSKDPEATTPQPTSPARKRRLLIIGALAILLTLVAVGIAVPLAIRHHSSLHSTQPVGSGSGTGDGGSPSTDPGYTKPVVGLNGSQVTTETGDTFLYINNFGGFWYEDPNEPYNNNAQSQDWTPPLTEQWDWQKDTVRG